VWVSVFVLNHIWLQREGKHQPVPDTNAGKLGKATSGVVPKAPVPNPTPNQCIVTQTPRKAKATKSKATPTTPTQRKATPTHELSVERTGSPLKMDDEDGDDGIMLNANVGPNEADPVIGALGSVAEPTPGTLRVVCICVFHSSLAFTCNTEM
jgi:hypothetical protein